MNKYLFKTLLLIPRIGIARSYGNSILNFLRNCHTVSIVYYYTFPPTVHKCSNFSTASLTLVVFFHFIYLFYSSHPNGYEVVSHCGFFKFILIFLILKIF